MMFYTTVTGWMLVYFWKMAAGVFGGMDSASVGADDDVSVRIICEVGLKIFECFQFHCVVGTRNRVIALLLFCA
jgi:SNF family Na+-dependent transporter